MKLKEKLDEALEKRNSLMASITNAETREALDKIELELRKCDIEIQGIKDAIEEEQRAEQDTDAAKRSAGASAPQGGLNPMGTYGGLGNIQTRNSEDEKEISYRKAFMDYALRGTEIPAEFRDGGTTITTELGVLIPKTVLNQIIEKLKSYGDIYSRVSQTNIKGGIELAISDTKPVATWTSEKSVSDKQEKTISGTVSFSYHKLQCRVAVSLEADTTSLSIFESTLTDNVYEAMIIALEEAIINGTGVKQPLGITKDARIKATQKVEVAAEQLKSWEAWSKVFAKVPKKKRQGAIIILNTETWEGDILGMTDANGQPIARVNVGLNGEDKPIFKGKPVVDVEDYLPSFEAAVAGEVFGIIINPKDYLLNSNMQMSIKRYFDEATDEWITKATLIADGKLADVQGAILLTKKA